MMNSWRPTMHAQKSKTALLLCLVSATLFAQQGSLVAVRPADQATLRGWVKRSDLPDGAESIKVNAKQSFHYTPASQAPALDLLSISFQVPHGAIEEVHCGVYLIGGDGKGTFFDPVSDSLPIVCEEIAAVRLSRHGTQPPDFLITGDFTSGSRAWRHNFVIGWDKHSGKYTLNTDGL